MNVLLYMIVKLPTALPIGLLCFGVFRWIYEQERGTFQRIARILLVLCLIVLSVNILYGFLRYSGVLLKPGDNGWSLNDLDGSWRDDGFDHFYWSGVMLLGALVGICKGKRVNIAVS